MKVKTLLRKVILVITHETERFIFGEVRELTLPKISLPPAKAYPYPHPFFHWNLSDEIAATDQTSQVFVLSLRDLR